MIYVTKTSYSPGREIVPDPWLVTVRGSLETHEMLLLRTKKPTISEGKREVKGWDYKTRFGILPWRNIRDSRVLRNLYKGVKRTRYKDENHPLSILQSLTKESWEKRTVSQYWLTPKTTSGKRLRLTVLTPYHLSSTGIKVSIVSPPPT